MYVPIAETPRKRTIKFTLFWVAYGLAAAGGYLKGEGTHELLAAMMGLLAITVAGILLKVTLDDRELLAAYYYEAGYRHGQETRLVSFAKMLNEEGDSPNPPEEG